MNQPFQGRSQSKAEEENKLSAFFSRHRNLRKLQ